MNKTLNQVVAQAALIKSKLLGWSHRVRSRLIAKGVLSILKHIYIIQFSLRLIWLIILTLYRNKLLKQSKSPDHKSSIEMKLSNTESWLLYFTSYSNDFVSSNIFNYALAAGVNILHCHLNLFRSLMANQDQVPLTNYLRDREGERIRIKSRIQDYLSEMILSNVNYTSHVIKTIVRDDLYRNQCDRCKYQLCKRRGSPLFLADRSSGSSQDNSRNVLTASQNGAQEALQRSRFELERELLDQQVLIGDRLRDGNLKCELDDKLRLLSREYNYLTAMKLDDCSLWPDNRQSAWLQQAGVYWFYFFCGSYVSVLIVVEATEMTALSINSYHRFVLKKQPYEWNPMRAWLAFDMILLPGIIIWSIASQLSELVIGILDQHQLMSKFQSDMLRFLQNVRELRQIRDELSGAELGSSNNQSLKLALREQQLRASCEVMAIKSYIRLRYFMDELQPLLRFAANITMLDLALIVIVCLTTLTYHIEVKRHEFLVFGMLGMVCIIKVNMSLLINALFTSRWLKGAKLPWSLIHCALEEIQCKDSDETDINNNEPASNLFEVKTDSAGLRYRKPRESDVSSKISIIEPGSVDSYETARSKSYSSSESSSKQCKPLMSAHIMFLWRRLISDNQKFSDRLTCNVFGFDSDYNLLISFNFWVISLIILYFTYKK